MAIMEGKKQNEDKEGSSSSNERGNPLVEVADATVVFKRRGGEPFRALEDLSFNIPQGTIFSLLGPNGSGKTTTVNLINGLLRPTGGQVSVAGLDPTKDRAEVLRKIALVPQETSLYDELSARENLVFHGNYYGVGGKELKEKIKEVLELVKLETRADDRVETFSGGMQRRLALARALLTSPEVLLLDEPTLGVDVQSRNAIWEQISELADEGLTVLLTTNYMEEAETLGSQVLILDQGVAVTSGSPDELKAALDRDTLILQFSSEPAARSAEERLSEEFSIDLDGSTLTLRPESPEAAIRALRTSPDGAGQDSEGLERFELRRPNLQDVFLHHTGRALRD